MALGVTLCTKSPVHSKAMHALARAVSRLAAAAYSENVFRECLAKYSNWSPASPVAAAMKADRSLLQSKTRKLRRERKPRD